MNNISAKTSVNDRFIRVHNNYLNQILYNILFIKKEIFKNFQDIIINKNNLGKLCLNQKNMMMKL